jgi:hypothetical protein
VDANPCPNCKTTLDDAGKCVTCAAAAEGLLRISCRDFTTIRDAMIHLEEAGLGPEMEQVPVANPTEARRPLWNLYIPADQLEDARKLLERDWATMVEGDEALEAMQRGQQGVTLDGGGEIACPACGHRFTPSGPEAECPDCGLALGVPGGAEEEGQGQ